MRVDEKLQAKVWEAGIGFPHLVAAGVERGVTSPILTAAVLIRFGGILDLRGLKESFGYLDSNPLFEESDILFQMHLWQVAEAHGCEKAGVFSKTFPAAQELRRKWSEAIATISHPAKSGKDEDVLDAIRLGMSNRLASQHGGRLSETFFDGARTGVLVRNSVLHDYPPTALVGQAFSHQQPGEPVPYNLIRLATSVSPKWLAENLPEVVDVFPSLSLGTYDQGRDMIVGEKIVSLYGDSIGTLKGIPVEDRAKARLALANQLGLWIWMKEMFSTANADLASMVEYNRLQLATYNRLAAFSEKEPFKFLKSREATTSWLQKQIGDATRLCELSNLDALRFPDVAQEVARIRKEKEEHYKAGGDFFRQAMGETVPIAQ